MTGPSTYRRDCLTDGRVHPTSCINNQTVGETHCWCNSDLCNDAPLRYLGSIDCYACQSGDFMDNGCGATLKPTSLYVTIESNCQSCEFKVDKAIGCTYN